ACRCAADNDFIGINPQLSSVLPNPSYGRFRINDRLIRQEVVIMPVAVIDADRDNPSGCKILRLLLQFGRGIRPFFEASSDEEQDGRTPLEAILRFEYVQLQLAIS